MIRDNEQFGRIGKSDVFGVPPGFGMAVGADDGQVPNRPVQPTGDIPQTGIGREQAILMHHCYTGHSDFPPLDESTFMSMISRTWSR